MAVASQPIEMTSGRGQYRALALRRIVLLCVLLVALCLSLSIDMALGPANM